MSSIAAVRQHRPDAAFWPTSSRARPLAPARSPSMPRSSSPASPSSPCSRRSRFFIGPVPITGQTLGVILVGASLGAARGAASLTTYMLRGPGRAARLRRSDRRTRLRAVAVVRIHRRLHLRRLRRRLVRASARGTASRRSRSSASPIASIIPFLFGVPYMAFILSAVMGVDITFVSVMEAGVLPFIAGGLIKAAVAAVAIPLAWRGVRALDARKDG